jgi:lysozyme
MINAGELEKAAEQFLVWKYAGGKILPGLLRRRQAERELFLTCLPTEQ